MRGEDFRHYVVALKFHCDRPKTNREITRAIARVLDFHHDQTGFLSMTRRTLALIASISRGQKRYLFPVGLGFLIALVASFLA